jgi:urease accessory protein
VPRGTVLKPSTSAPARAAPSVADILPPRVGPRAELASPRWVGELELEFARAGSRTVIARRRHQGPLLVQRAFQEQDGSCQVYLLHPPGGVVGGDQLGLRIGLGPGTRALITTPAAAKLYESAARTALLTQDCQAADGALLELLPQETIVYDGAYAESSTHVALAATAQFIGWEITCLGRDERGFSRGRQVQRWRLTRQGRPLWDERSLIEGGSPVLEAEWGLAGRPVLGTLVATGTPQGLIEVLRQMLPESPAPETERDWFAVTQLGEVLVCRYLGYSAEVAKRHFCAVWAKLRWAASGQKAVAPRIWAL